MTVSRIARLSLLKFHAKKLLAYLLKVFQSLIFIRVMRHTTGPTYRCQDTWRERQRVVHGHRNLHGLLLWELNWGRRGRHFWWRTVKTSTLGGRSQFVRKSSLEWSWLHNPHLPKWLKCWSWVGTLACCWIWGCAGALCMVLAGAPEVAVAPLASWAPLFYWAGSEAEAGQVSGAPTLWLRLVKQQVEPLRKPSPTLQKTR